MGRLTGTCRTLTGDNIRIVFISPKLATRELEICNVTTQVEGGFDYSPIKYATATITVLTNGVELMPLCTTPNTTVTVKNTTTGKTLFSGYVTQNTFSQSLIADTLTVECVSKLGYTKFLPVPELALIQNNTLARWILSFAEIVQLGVWLDKSVKIRRRSDSKTTTKYYDLAIPGEYFLNSTKPAVWGNKASYEGQRLMIFDALTMIAESLRMTFFQVGDVLMLIEPTNIGPTKYFINIADNSTVVWKNDKIRLTEDSFGSIENTVSTIPIYTSFSLLHENPGQRTVSQPIFDAEYMVRAGSGAAYIDGDEKIFCERMTSMLVDTVDDEAYSASFVAYESYKISDIGDSTTKRYYDRSWNSVLRLSSTIADGYQHEVCKTKSSVARTVSPCRGKALKLKIKVQLTDDNVVLYPKNPTDFDKFYLYGSLRVGKYYLSDSFSDIEWGGDLWVTSRKISKFNILPDGSVYLEYDIDKRLFEFPYTFADIGRSEVEFVIYAGARRFTCFIEEFEITEKIAEGVNTGANHPASTVVEYFGTYNEARTLDQVKLPIDLYSITADKSFGATIDNVDYASGKPGSMAVGAELLFGDDNKTMIEKIAAMSKVEDGLQFDLTLRDEDNAIQLSQPITSSLWPGVKTVVGYEKNILDNTINVTLI